jgi:hypothetical protein
LTLLTLSLAAAIAGPVQGDRAPRHATYLYPYRWNDLAVYYDPAGLFFDALALHAGSGDMEEARRWMARELYEAWFLNHSYEYDFLLVLTSGSVSVGSFYLPSSNDVEGTGAPALANGAGYDEDPKGNLKGLLFMNKAGLWEDAPEAGAYTFQRLMGQRWCGQASARVAGLDDGALTSGEGTWSYWLSTPNSPCGGNHWIFTGADSYSAYNDSTSAYSDLDLYLMGLLAPEEVAPLEFLKLSEEDQAAVHRDAASTPEYYAYYGTSKDYTITVVPEVIEVTVDDVIAAEGPRVPSYEDSPRSFRVGVMYLVMARDTIDEETLGEIEDLRDTLVGGWEEAVRGAATLDTSLGTSLATPLEFEAEDTGDGGGAGDTGDTGADTADTADTGDTGGDTDGGDGGGDGGGEDSSPAVEEDPPEVMAEPACSCGATPGVGWGAWLLAPLLVGLRRRSSRPR